MKTINKIQNTQKITPLTATIVAASLLSAIYYSFYIFNASLISDIILYLLMVFVEVYVLIMMIFSWWTILFHDAGNVTSNDYYSKKFFQNGNKATVAIIYTCVNESLEIIEAGLKALTSMEGNNYTVYIGDDGLREEVKALAKKYGAVYKTRDNRRFFKAGNINNILNEIKEDFVAVFDSDHHPTPNFLTETLPFFADEKVGFVQCPQYYTNTDNVISIGASGAQSIFYELLMPGKNSFNAAICVGTNVIFRKKALEDATNGKIYELSHSEDIHTGLSLHEHGWKSVYVPKVLASGLAPDTISMFFKQQERWARGGFSILFSRNPIFIKGLTWEQRIQYMFSAMHYFSGFAILYFLLIPILFLLTEAKPLKATDGLYWLIHFAPFFVSKFLLLFYLVEKFDVSVISTSIALFPVYIKAFFSEISVRDYNWTATNSNTKTSTVKTRSIYDLMFWHYAVVFLSIAAIIVGFLTIDERSSLFMFSVWAILNIAILLHFIFGVQKIEKGKVYEK